MPPDNVDITVFGLTVPTCVLHDIGRDVPHGETVVIPGDVAYRSKDLWRAIGQRQIFQIKRGPGPTAHLPIAAPQPSPPVPVPVPRDLELEEENKALKAALSNQSQKLDSIIALLQAGVPMAAIQAATRPQQSVGVVSDEVPIFIPSSIKPENAEARIESRRSETEASKVSDAAEKLRELRQKGRQ
jgi:hypothetical protein